MLKYKIVVSLLILSVIGGKAQTLQQADSLHQRGRELMNEGKIVESRECCRQAMEIRQELLGKVSEDYINSLNNYAMTFYMTNDTLQAYQNQLKVMELCSQLPAPHPKLYLFAIYMGTYTFRMGDISNAARYWETALPLVEKYGEEYEWLLERLASMYEKIGDSDSYEHILELIEDHNNHELTKPCDEPKCMLDRAQVYQYRGDNAMAKDCYVKLLVMEMDKETLLKVYESYAQFLHSAMHDNEGAAENQYRASLLRKSAVGEDASFAESMKKAGMYYNFTLDASSSQRALACFQTAKGVYKRLGNTAASAECTKQMAHSFQIMEDYPNMRDCYKEVLEYLATTDSMGKDYPKIMEEIATAEKFNKEYEASIAHYKQALRLYVQRGMIEELGDALIGLKMCYYYAGMKMDDADYDKYQHAIDQARLAKLDDLIDSEKEGLELTRKYLGQSVYAGSLGNIANAYAMKEDYERAVDYFQQFMENEREAIRESFRLQNESERLKTWEEEAARDMNNIKELLVSLPQEQGQLRDTVAALAYDTQLLSKGILLNSAIEFERLISESGDDHLKHIYQQIKKNSTEIERLRREARDDEELEQILELNQKNQQLQVELNNSCKEMRDFTQYISFDWKDVQSHLSDDDIAVEFMNIEDVGVGDGFMMALVLTKEMLHPVAVTLWDEEKLMDCSKTEFYKAIGDSLIRTIFNGRDKNDVIKEMKTRLETLEIPFKPELSLYLNYLKNKADTTKGKFIADEMIWLKYQKLIQQDDILFDSPDVGMIVWGRISPYLKGKKRIFFSADGMLNNIGVEYLQYNGKPLSEQFEVYRLSSTKELCYRRKNVKPMKAALFGDINYNDEATKSTAVQRSLASLRGSGDTGIFADLSNTLREISDIQGILKNKGVKDTERFHDTEASKEAFLGMTDTKVNLLHIATHGMYKDKKESSDTESMQNSLLAFAGANLDDNALVTAADIAKMNLRQCDLAVLSACETGLGKLGGDGVFGLQRGFKNAGVHTLLMSLKNVYDDSTAELMISFYKHLMDGATKREALVKAQQDIREKGFNDPKYWATFILLDAF